MQEYYELLGLTEAATDEEITARYNELKAKAKEDRWLDGEAGNEAAKLLNKLDVAYAEIMASRKEREENTEGDSAYEEVSRLLKEGKLAEAQTKLDDFNERGAEWHYLQAVVFYKKNWMNESKKQLEIAMQLDPENVKYRDAYGKVNAKMDFNNRAASGGQNQGAQSAQGQNRGQDDGSYSPYGNDNQMGGCICSDCLMCCYVNLCVNCLYNICCGCY